MGVGPIWLDNVQCNGTEERVEECGYNGWGNTPCYHSSDASVVCESKPHECYIEFESGNEPTNVTLSLGMRPLT